MIKTVNHVACWILSVLCLGSCDGGSAEGLRLTPWGTGPTVVFDLNQSPFPEIPLPNNLVTRPDPGSVTGRRLNFSSIASTTLLGRLQEATDRLDGFGTFMPISIRFDAPLDLDNLIDRHQQNLEYADDAVYLVDVDPKSPDYGQLVFLDMGRGNYPLLLKHSNDYFLSDPRGEAGNLVFDTYEEDRNGNGVLDPGEDTDDDGVLDHPNLWPPDLPLKDSLLTHYESETNTLLFRPVVPLREHTTYAVVLTDRLTGRDRQPIRSPFSYIHHLDQTDELSRLPLVLSSWKKRYGIDFSTDQVAFAWTFTTQTVTHDLVALREGLYGVGPYAWLSDKFPPEVTPEPGKDDRQPPPLYVVETERLMPVIRFIYQTIIVKMSDLLGDVEPLIRTYDSVDYFVSGSFVSPNFLDNPDASFQIDSQRGSAQVGSSTITFSMAVPKETDRYHPPFPVIIYSHGYSTARLEFLGFSGVMARYGIATVAIDAWGHGVGLDQEMKDLVISVGSAWGCEPFFKATMQDRARDLTGDGVPDSGGDFFTASGFHTRDALRQTVIDSMQLIRVMKSFDGSRTWKLDQDGDGREDLAGDFNNDGRVDAGGPNVKYFAWGQSMGAAHTALLGAVDPALSAIAPTSPVGGLQDVGMRSELEPIHQSMVLPMMGPLVVGGPATSRPYGTIQISLQVPLSNEGRVLDISEVSGVSPGDRVTVVNLGNGLKRTALVKPSMNFRVSIPADADDSLVVILGAPDGQEKVRLDRWEKDVWYRGKPNTQEPTYRAGEVLRTPAAGLGLPRCTPELRRMMSLYHHILEPSDPVSYARHYFSEPFTVFPEGARPKNILELVTVGDPAVSPNTQLTLGRAAGIIPYQDIDPRYGMSIMDWLIHNHVPEGITGIGRFPGNDILFDPDGLDEGRNGYQAPGPSPHQRLRINTPTATGVSGVRFIYLNPEGQHGVYVPEPNKPFDVNSYVANLVGMFFATNGQEIVDDLCLEKGTCPLP